MTHSSVSMSIHNPEYIRAWSADYDSYPDQGFVQIDFGSNHVIYIHSIDRVVAGRLAQAINEVMAKPAAPLPQRDLDDDLDDEILF